MSDPFVDLWFALVAIRNALCVLDLAADLTKDKDIAHHTASFQASTNAKGARDVFEHFDAYFRGKGNLQKADRDFATHVLHGYPGGIVAVLGGRELNVGDALEDVESLLWDVRKKLPPG